MILYLAGGFHFSKDIASESKLADHLIERYGRYNRLCTFYYTKDADNIIKTMERFNEDERITENS